MMLYGGEFEAYHQNRLAQSTLGRSDSSDGVGHGEIAHRKDSRDLGDLRPRRLSLGPHVDKSTARSQSGLDQQTLEDICVAAQICMAHASRIYCDDPWT